MQCVADIIKWMISCIGPDIDFWQRNEHKKMKFTVDGISRLASFKTSNWMVRSY
jgi:hypothetical protein